MLHSLPILQPKSIMGVNEANSAVCRLPADFIDPLHHEVATGRPSINLDGWMMGQEQVLSAFQRHTADADIAVVEGVMGLFDGRDGTTEAGSTAEVAKWLGAPVLLVLDCSAVARSAAAIVKGYQEFDPALCLAALLFNKVGGAAHTKWLSDAIASAGLGVKVLGGIPKDDAVAIQERYLGLHLPQDRSMPPGLIANLATLVRNHVDLDAVIKLASTAHTTLPTASTELDGAPSDGSTEAHLAKVAPTVGGLRISDTANTEGDGAAEEAPRPQSGGLASAGSGGGGKKKRKKAKRQASQPQEQAAQLAAAPSSTTAGSTGPAAIDGITAPSEAEVGPNEQSTASLPLPSPPVRIAVARDAAFCFYYFDNLTLLAEAGAEIVLFSPLHDPLPPDIAAVYLGGGYPEHHAAELAENKLFRAELKAFADAGGVVYAECGGLLVLSQSLQPRGEPAQPMGEQLTCTCLLPPMPCRMWCCAPYPLCGNISVLPFLFAVGVFPFKAVLPPGKYTMGYVEIETTAECPLFPPGVKARGHVHHASELVEEHHVGGVVAADAAPHGGTNGHVGAAWRTGYLIRPQVPGAPESPEGFSCHNVLASYVHLHFGGCPGLAKALVERSRQVDVAAVNEAVAAAASTAPMLEGACAQATPPSSVSFISVFNRVQLQMSIPCRGSILCLVTFPNFLTIRSSHFASFPLRAVRYVQPWPTAWHDRGALLPGLQPPGRQPPVAVGGPQQAPWLCPSPGVEDAEPRHNAEQGGQQRVAEYPVSAVPSGGCAIPWGAWRPLPCAVHAPPPHGGCWRPWRARLAAVRVSAAAESQGRI